MKRASLTERAIVVNPADNVATALANLEAGERMELSVQDKPFFVILSGSVPYGHKFSLTTIVAGAAVIKYGETIGIATSLIRTGDYVHVHNLASARARGDLMGGGE